MSNHGESSDSDDFFDACQDFESTEAQCSSLLVVDEGIDEKPSKIENPNSPSRVGADLSLDCLITPEYEKSNMVIAVENPYIEKNVVEENKFDFESVVLQGEAVKISDVMVTEKHPVYDVTDSAVTITEDKPFVHKDFSALSENKSATVETMGYTYHDNDKQLYSEKSLDDVEVACNELNMQKPDLVASIKERPCDLPGLHNFGLSAADVGDAGHKKTRISHPSPVRPKRPPPPRPKAPPKRPPPPKTPTLKPYLSSVDDGLLTPNSTVDNITREFAASLVSNNCEETAPKNDVQTNKNLVPVSSTASPKILMKELNKNDDDKSINLKDSQSKRQSLGRRLSSTPNPGSQLDNEILSTVIVRNLDTGQTMPLSMAAEQVSQCLNPLALQIMSRTKEFSCASVSAEEKPATKLEQSKLSLYEEDTISVGSDDITIGFDAGSGKAESSRKLKAKSKGLKHFFGKNARRVKEVAGSQMEKAVHKVKHTRVESVHSDALHVSSDEEPESMSGSFVKTKVSSSNKDSQHFSRLKLVQDIAVHVGAVWSMKFSHCGRLLATAGQNNIIWVWVLKDYYAFFNDLRNKYDSKDRGAVFATPPRSSMEPPRNEGDLRQSRLISEAGGTIYNESEETDDEEDAPFRSLPFSSYVGHTADVLDLAWSKNYFTLSSSMDKTVRLWHVSQKECLCCFQHIDFVTAIAFHPRDDRYFLSGSLDSKLRLWNIPEKKVALWNEVATDSSSGSSTTGSGALITTVNFCENGKFAVCGTYDGRCLFYDTEHLKYHTQIHVRSSRRRNNKGHKITGIEPLVGEHKILVTSNDSRVRLYDLRDLSLTCKFKGLTNLSSQIKASFSHDNKYIICGSEDKCVYIWKTNPPQDVTKLSSFRRDRNDAWESIRAHDAVVTCAIFPPYPHLMARNNEKVDSGSRISLRSSIKKSSSASNIFIISADFNGVIKVFSNS